MFNESSIEPELFSLCDLTSKIFKELLELRDTKSSGSMFSIDSTFLFALVQELIPPDKYPLILSNPTLESLNIASSSLPSGAIKIMG